MDNKTNPQLGMKWFKFIVYVQLFLSALLMAITGILNVMSITKYSYPLSLKITDGINAAILVFFIVIAFVTRQKLAHFKKDAPKTYLMYLSAVTLETATYLLATSIFSNNTELLLENIPSIIASIVMIFINRIYFKKRQHLFVN